MAPGIAVPATSVIVVVTAGRPATSGRTPIIVAHEAAPFVTLGLVVAATTIPPAPTATIILVTAPGGTAPPGRARIIVAHEAAPFVTLGLFVAATTTIP